MMRKISWLVCLSVSLLIVSPARAFGVSPVRYLVTVDPGERQSVSVTVKNDEPKAKKFVFSVVGVQDDGAGHPLFAVGLDPAEGWVKPEIGETTISSGQKKKIIFNVAVPQGAAPGSHYLGLAVEATPDLAGQTVIAGRLTVLLVLQVAGIVKESVSLRSEIPAAIAMKKEWPLIVELKNNGTIETPITGRAIIRNWRGQTVFSAPLVLGNQLIPGAYRQIISRIVADKIRWPGLYETEAEIKYGKTNQTISSTARLWYLPLESIIGVGLIVLLLFILKFLRRKRSV